MPTTAYSGYLSGYANDVSVGVKGIVANKLGGLVPVEEKSGKAPKFAKGAFTRGGDAQPRAPLTKAATIDFDVTELTYNCKQFSIRTPLPRQDKANYSRYIDIQHAKTRLVVEACLRRRERVVSDALFVTGVWTTEKTGVSSSPSTNQFLKWSDDASKPVNNVMEMHEDFEAATGGQSPTVAVIGRRLYRRLLTHPNILTYVQATTKSGSPQAVRSALAELFDVPEIIVPKAFRATAGTESSDTPTLESIIATDSFTLLHTAERPGLDTPSALNIYSWSPLDDVKDETSFAVEKYDEPELQTSWIEASLAIDVQPVAPDYGAIALSLL